MTRTTLKAIVIAASMLFSTSVFAVDTVPTKASPDLASVRIKIKAKDFKAAIAELTPMLQSHQHADVYNLLGFSHRKSGEMKEAATYYAKALDFDPDHKGALEYQGEMFIQLGEVEKARGNLARLIKLCPTGCEERGDLEQAIEATAKPKAS
jgi:tetratricopeptide (TPR) repeat protein